jgi:thiosulfate/3-mercaptopyruvate sulfurtransferase
MEFTSLVSVATLQANLNRHDWVVVDCRFLLTDPAAGRKMYNAGHIPNARYADLDCDLSSPITADSGRHPLPSPQDFMDRLGAWGIKTDTQIVAYDQIGGAFAARLWWLARWVGHRRVAVLNGGFPAWKAAGLPVDTQSPYIEPKNYVGSVNDSLWVTSEAILANITSSTYRLIDAREAPRFHGMQEPIDAVAGHIPGALNLPFKENLAADGTFLPAGELRSRFLAALGTQSSAEVVHMCGSGVTACHNLLAMEAAGLSCSKLYAGSWSEWIRNPARPVARD